MLHEFKFSDIPNSIGLLLLRVETWMNDVASANYEAVIHLM